MVLSFEMPAHRSPIRLPARICGSDPTTDAKDAPMSTPKRALQSIVFTIYWEIKFIGVPQAICNDGGRLRYGPHMHQNTQLHYGPLNEAT